MRSSHDSALGADRLRVRKYLGLLQQDLSAVYSRDVLKWLLIAPIIGIFTGVVITGVAVAILDRAWGFFLPRLYAHHWLIIPVVAAGFVVAGLIMQYLTDNPDLHSTEEIIRSYHEHQGDINPRPFWFKLVAALFTVGFGGSAALEGPSIYGGGAIGSWLWTRLGRLGLRPEDRRIMLISGAAAGMAAVFRAPLTGLVFALEMPFRDDLAHEALLPAFIAAVVAYATLVAMLGSHPLFYFVGTIHFAAMDLVWAALLGLICGLLAMCFAILFRRVRSAAVRSRLPHALKMLAGGLATGLCGLIFVSFFSQPLIPLGPDYEVVREMLARPHSSTCLLAFFVLKAAATIFTLGVGGVSAAFVPLLLLGGAVGNIFGQTVLHAATIDLFAAVGMASFIAAAYKTPLAAVLFVAETTGGIAFLIPSLIGAAVAYAVSGEASVSGDQRLHQMPRLSGPTGIKVREIMQPQVIGVEATSTVRDFVAGIGSAQRHPVYPVFDHGRAVAIVSWWEVSQLPPERWDRTAVGEVARHEISTINKEADLGEAVRMLALERRDRLLLVLDGNGAPVGILTNGDVLNALHTGGLNHH